MSENNKGSTKNNHRFVLSLDFWFLVAGICVSAAVGAVVLRKGFGEADTAIMVFLTVVITVLLRIHVAIIGKAAAIPAGINSMQTSVTHTRNQVDHLVRLAATQPELLTNINAVLERAKSIQNNADIRIDAVWGAFPPGKILKDYFTTTLAKDIYTRRIVSIGKSNTVDVLLDHIREQWGRLISGKYKIFITRPLAYEMLIVDNQEAAYFHFSGGGIACIFLYSNDNRFVNGVRSEWDELLADATEFISTAFGEDFDEEQIRQWLQKRLDEYK